MTFSIVNALKMPSKGVNLHNLRKKHLAGQIVHSSLLHLK